jgi:hypothetical protein
MTPLATLTLDETYDSRLTEIKLKDSGRLDSVRSPMVRRMIYVSLGEYLREIKDPSTNMSGRFMYDVTADDLDEVVDMLFSGLLDYT